MTHYKAGRCRGTLAGAMLVVTFGGAVLVCAAPPAQTTQPADVSTAQSGETSATQPADAWKTADPVVRAVNRGVALMDR